MIRKVKDIAIKDLVMVDIFCPVGRIQQMVFEKRCNYFLVVDDGEIIGVLTLKELIKTHPNRIAVDAVSGNYDFISVEASFWEAKDIMKRKDVEILIAREGKEIQGIITQDIIEVELGKHFDLLTELYKSDFIYFMAEKLVKSGTDFSVIFVDINNFGKINKVYGHIEGNAILKEVSKLLISSIPKGTYICRFGGDEFVILVPLDVADPKEIAYNLVSIVSSYSFHDNIVVSISAGIVPESLRNVKAYIDNNLDNNRDKQSSKLCLYISNIINSASLACSKAKLENTNVNICNDIKYEKYNAIV